MFKAAVAIIVPALFVAGGAKALECRALSGETFTAGSANYSVGVKGCGTTPQAASPAPAQRLSPLLQLYERPGASADISLRASRSARPQAPHGVVPSATVDLPAAPAVRSGPSRPMVVSRPKAGSTIARAPAWSTQPHVYDAAVSGVARMYNIDPTFMGALVRQESGFHPGAVSAKGARGLMQVMPGTARRFGVDGRALQNPVVNLAVGAAYLKSLQRQYGNNLPLVLAAYNAGEGAVNRHGRRVPPYRETRTYVSSILTQYRGGLYDRLSTGR